MGAIRRFIQKCEIFSSGILVYSKLIEIPQYTKVLAEVHYFFLTFFSLNCLTLPAPQRILATRKGMEGGMKANFQVKSSEVKSDD